MDSVLTQFRFKSRLSFEFKLNIGSVSTRFQFSSNLSQPKFYSVLTQSQWFAKGPFFTGHTVYAMDILLAVAWSLKRVPSAEWDEDFSRTLCTVLLRKKLLSLPRNSIENIIGFPLIASLLHTFFHAKAYSWSTLSLELLSWPDSEKVLLKILPCFRSFSFHHWKCARDHPEKKIKW